MPGLAWLLIVVGLAWVARVTVFTRPRAPGQFALVDVSAALQIVLVALTAGLVLASGRLLPIWTRLGGTSGRTLFYYYLVCAASAVWSFMPEFSLYRGVEFMALSAGIFVSISYCRDFGQAERLTLIIGIIVSVMSLTVNLRLRGIPRSLDDLHTNSYTVPALMVFCYCVGEYFGADRERKRELKRAGVMGFGLLTVGTSAASNVSALFGLIIVATMLRKRWLAALSGAILFLGVAIIVILQPDPAAILQILFPGKDEKAIMTMTGRTNMWAELWDYFLQNPVVGGGFAVLSSSGGGLHASNPHNSILAAMLGTGLVGLTVALLFMGKLSLELLSSSRTRQEGSIGCTAAILAAMVNSLSKPMILGEFEETSMAFVAFTAMFLLWVHRRPRPSYVDQPRGLVRPNILN